MAYLERNPWQEPQRTRRTNGQIIIGCLLGLAVLIILAIIEIQAAVIIVALAALTAVILLVTSRLGRRR